MGSSKRDGKNPGAAAKQATSEAGQGEGPALDRIIQAQIGDKLRSLYGELVEQPVPDRFKLILDQLSAGKSRNG